MAHPHGMLITLTPCHSEKVFTGPQCGTQVHKRMNKHTKQQLFGAKVTFALLKSEVWVLSSDGPFCPDMPVYLFSIVTFEKNMNETWRDSFSYISALGWASDGLHSDMFTLNQIRIQIWVRHGLMVPRDSHEGHSKCHIFQSNSTEPMRIHGTSLWIQHIVKYCF